MPDKSKTTSQPALKRLSIVIPAYQEERFIGALLEKVIAVDLGPLGMTKEIIVVDDGSRDRTAEIAGSFPEVTLHRKAKNEGKGSAVQAGIRLATGNYIMIQDADLEYDPGDYIPMLRALIEGSLDAVYGSRYMKYPRRKAGQFCFFEAPRAVAARLCRRTEPQPDRPGDNRPLHLRHRHRVEAVPCGINPPCGVSDSRFRAGS
jgi:glycosyltransferase involved in cell wall biosynthesis